MNDAIASLLLIILLCLLILSPFAALAMLMLLLFTTAIIGFVNILIKSIVKSTSTQSEKKT
jgi:membrane glycosyltransferase